jgi:hypothetical protein
VRRGNNKTPNPVPTHCLGIVNLTTTVSKSSYFIERTPQSIRLHTAGDELSKTNPKKPKKREIGVLSGRKARMLVASSRPNHPILHRWYYSKVASHLSTWGMIVNSSSTSLSTTCPMEHCGFWGFGVCGFFGKFHTKKKPWCFLGVLGLVFERGPAGKCSTT